MSLCTLWAVILSHCQITCHGNIQYVSDDESVMKQGVGLQRVYGILFRCLITMEGVELQGCVGRTRSGCRVQFLGSKPYSHLRKVAVCKALRLLVPLEALVYRLKKRWVVGIRRELYTTSCRAQAEINHAGSRQVHTLGYSAGRTSFCNINMECLRTMTAPTTRTSHAGVNSNMKTFNL